MSPRNTGGIRVTVFFEKHINVYSQRNYTTVHKKILILHNLELFYHTLA
jgi:hypothetical protein